MKISTKTCNYHFNHHISLRVCRHEYNCFFFVCSLFSYKEIAECDSVQYLAGGSCQNTLRVVQWILRKPKVATFFGCVGNDEYACKLEEKARADGVNVIYQRNESLPTGTCAVAITGHHRSLCGMFAKFCSNNN